MKRDRFTITGTGLVLLFHTVGLIGLCVPSSRSLFLKTVPFHLLLMMAILTVCHRPKTGRFFLFVAVTFVVGIVVEWVGVHKAWLFGHYYYGGTLGLKVDGIPLIIGVNWGMLIYAAGVTMQKLPLNIFGRMVTGSVILVVLDLLIEPLAAPLDYWHWQDNHIPVYNYVCWFGVSVILLYVFQKFRFHKQSIVAPVFLAVQFVFFALLNWLI